jgi:hypothetical protein
MYKEDTTAANKQLYKTYKGRELKYITEMAKKFTCCSVASSTIITTFLSGFHFVTPRNN